MRTKPIVASLLLVLLVIGNGFVNRFTQFPVPKDFPKPVYTFTNNPPSDEGFALGRQLFYDPILSADSSVSCGTCHQHFAAFAHVDHALSHGIAGRIGTRNVPALQNLVWNSSMMWDGSISSMEQQPVNPITNANEMNETMAQVVRKLQGRPAYVLAFKQVFHDTVSSSNLLKALAQFTARMVSANSKYDQYVAGKIAFSAAEKNGLRVFQIKCANCHPPPLFTDNSFRNNGLPPDAALNDAGRGAITNNPHDQYRFKVPTLRNIEVTFPYMHDGRMQRLRDVVEHYAHVHLESTGADLSLRKIGLLSDKDKKDLIAFMLTLTDREFLMNQLFDEVK